MTLVDSPCSPVLSRLQLFDLLPFLNVSATTTHHRTRPPFSDLLLEHITVILTRLLHKTASSLPAVAPQDDSSIVTRTNEDRAQVVPPHAVYWGFMGV